MNEYKADTFFFFSLKAYRKAPVTFFFLLGILISSLCSNLAGVVGGNDKFFILNC